MNLTRFLHESRTFLTRFLHESRTFLTRFSHARYTVCTKRFGAYTKRCTVYTKRYTVCTKRCTVYTKRYTVCTKRYTVYTKRFARKAARFTRKAVRNALYTFLTRFVHDSRTFWPRFGFSTRNISVIIMVLSLITVNQLLFACEKFSQSSRDLRHRKYFSPRTSP